MAVDKSGHAIKRMSGDVYSCGNKILNLLNVGNFQTEGQK